MARFGRVSLLLSGPGAGAMNENILRPWLRSLVLCRIVEAHFRSLSFYASRRGVIFGLVSFLLPFSLGVWMEGRIRLLRKKHRVIQTALYPRMGIRILATMGNHGFSWY